MKNQNDLIVAGVAFVLMAIVVAVAIFTKRDPVNPGTPAPVDQSMPALPANDVVLADSLPGAQSSGGGPGPSGSRGGPAGLGRPAMGGGGPGPAPAGR